MKKKIRQITIMVLSFSLMMMTSLMSLNALGYEIEPYSIETYTVSRNFLLLNNHGSVTCTVKIDRNIQTGKSRVANVSTTPHFDSAWPLLMTVGTPTSTPASGEYVTNGRVIVHYKYGMRLIGPTWQVDCELKI